jgi:hypothetical protein
LGSLFKKKLPFCVTQYKIFSAPVLNFNGDKGKILNFKQVQTSAGAGSAIITLLLLLLGDKGVSRGLSNNQQKLAIDGFFSCTSRSL